MTETSSALDTMGRVVLGANGAGSLTLAPSNAHERWEISSTSVRTSTAVLNPVYATYLGPATPGNSVDSTYTGNQDDSDTKILVPYGAYITCAWTGGDVGAVATVVIKGTRYQDR